MDLIKTLPVIEGEGVVLDEITRDDAADYCVLATDDELNKYWGYDYRTDIPEPGADAFFSDLKNGFDSKQYISWAIRVNGRFIGEVVLYDRDTYCGAELGARIFSDSFGRGYGRAAYAAAAEYLTQFGFSHLRARCFRQNVASRKMILSAGFEEIGEDNTFYYFVKH